MRCCNHQKVLRFAMATYEQHLPARVSTIVAALPVLFYDAGQEWRPHRWRLEKRVKEEGHLSVCLESNVHEFTFQINMRFRAVQHVLLNVFHGARRLWRRRTPLIERLVGQFVGQQSEMLLWLRSCQFSYNSPAFFATGDLFFLGFSIGGDRLEQLEWVQPWENGKQQQVLNESKVWLTVVLTLVPLLSLVRRMSRRSVVWTPVT